MDYIGLFLNAATSQSRSLLYLALIFHVFMSPVSPVFYTEATVSIGLKNVLRVKTFIHSIMHIHIILDVHVDRQSAHHIYCLPLIPYCSQPAKQARLFDLPLPCPQIVTARIMTSRLRCFVGRLSEKSRLILLFLCLVGQ